VPETSIVAGKEQERYYPYTSLFYANRHSFWEAGQNSFTLPPAQDQDAFLQLYNVEPVLQGVLQRRRGYQIFSKLSPTEFVHSYAYRNDGLGLRRVVWSPLALVPGSATGPVATDEQGNTILNPIFAESATAAFAPRMVLSRDYGFFSDGAAVDLVKWDGTTNTNAVTNWGTSIGGTPVSTFGPNYAGAGADVPSSGGIAWSNPGNVVGPPDGNLASVNLPAPGGVNNSDALQATNYGFAVPTATTAGPVAGIQVTVTCSYTGTLPNNPETINVNLLKAGAVVGGGLFLVPFTTSFPVIVGGPGDLWGTSWLNTDINNTGFGVSIEAFNSGSTAYTLNVDSIAVEVFCAGGSITFTTNTATTNIVLLNGRVYTYAFQNSSTLTTSDLGPFSVTTGPLTGNQVNLTNIPVSTDPQVDTVLLLATLDGGDETTLYLLGTVPNGTTTFIDTMPDSLSSTYIVGPTLETQPLYQDTDYFGNLHGIADNATPPVGLNYMVKHKGRLYGAVGRALYYSKNLDDVTTANGLITCRFEEAWPTINTFDISETAETIQGLMSDGETLWIATETAIRRLIGDSPSNFQVPEIQFNDVGLFNQDTWKVVFFEGQPVGTMWLTKDFKVMMSDFNTYEDVGKPIQDVLNTINNIPGPGSVHGGSGLVPPIVHASYVSKGPADYYMLHIPTGSDFRPNLVCVFDLRKKKWFIWEPTDFITTSLFLVDASGNPRWLFGASETDFPVTHSYQYEWIQGLFQDEVNSGLFRTPVSYPVTIQTTWQDMGDYGLRKFVNQIIPTTGDNSNLTVMVEAASNEQDFNSPTIVVPPTVVSPAPIPDDVFVPLASGPGHHRSFRFTFMSPPSTIQNALTGYSVEAGVIHRY
jgi:hypothetical protein